MVHDAPRVMLGIRVSIPLRDRIVAAAKRAGVSVTEYVASLLDRHTP